MLYHLTIKDIQKQTGLKDNFIRRCLSHMKDIFEPHISRGENNTLLFDDSVYPLFNRIKQLKEKDKLTLPEIERRLGYKPVKPDDKADNNGYQTLPNQLAKPDNIDTVRALYERLLKEKDKTYQTNLEAQQVVIDTLKSHVNLLTDGRSPEEIKKEAEEKRKRKEEILDQLEELKDRWFKGKEKQALIDKLRSLD